MIVARAHFTFGGVVYRMMVDARHAASLAQLAVQADRTPPMLSEVDYRHTSNLPRGRCEWIRDAMLADAMWAISCDADTSFDAIQLHASIMRVRDGIALGVAPVRIAGTTTTSNITARMGDGVTRRLDVADAGKLAAHHGEIEHGGFGLVVLNLAWLRKHWPAPTPEGVGWERSEDTAICDSIRARGGKIIALPVATSHHGFDR